VSDDDLSPDDKLYLDLTQAQFDQWLTDLRSGEFQQGRMALKYTLPGGSDLYCCLGVLGERVGCLKKNNDGDWFAEGSAQETEYLAWTYITEEIQTTLAKLNDDDRYNFDEIAEWIEKNYAPKL
jgi:hypothetical protein